MVNDEEEMSAVFNIGSIIKTTSGRDLGRYYVIYQVVDEHYLLLVDGYKHGVNNPKRKNVKHIVLIYPADEELASAIVEKKNNLDADIRATLRRLCPKSTGRRDF
jgi:ribosomal protein L14E/L6E/L27E